MANALEQREMRKNISDDEMAAELDKLVGQQVNVNQGGHLGTWSIEGILTHKVEYKQTDIYRITLPKRGGDFSPAYVIFRPRDVWYIIPGGTVVKANIPLLSPLVEDGSDNPTPEQLEKARSMTPGKLRALAGAFTKTVLEDARLLETIEKPGEIH